MKWKREAPNVFFPELQGQYKRIVCVPAVPGSDLRGAPLPSPPLEPQVKQFAQHACPRKCHQSNCPRHLCASYCIGCSAAGVVRQQVTVQISFKYLPYLEHPSVERGPGNRAGCSQQQKMHLHQLLGRSFTGLMMDLCRTVTRFCRTIALNCSTIHIAV